MGVLKHQHDGDITYCYFVDIDKYREKHRLLLNALRHVETSFIMPASAGDDSLSIGPLQIRFDLNLQCFFRDVYCIVFEFLRIIWLFKLEYPFVRESLFGVVCSSLYF